MVNGLNEKQSVMEKIVLQARRSGYTLSLTRADYVILICFLISLSLSFFISEIVKLYIDIAQGWGEVYMR